MSGIEVYDLRVKSNAWGVIISFSRPSHATVVAYLALIVALSGSAYAASKIGSSDIKKNAIKSKHIATGAVGTKDAKDDDLTGDDIKGDGLTGDDIDETTLGEVPSAADVASDDIMRRGGNSPEQQEQGGIYYSYFANTSQTNSYDFGQVELRTNSTPGQFAVCKPAGAGNTPISVVMYVNGVRSTGLITNPNECTATFDAGVGGDFDVSARRVHIFGIHSGDGAGNENYALLGIGSL